MGNGNIISDEDLVRTILDGDNQSFHLIIERYKNMVFSICLRLISEREEANDQAQEIFIKVFQNLRKFRERSRFSTWLYRIAYNHCIDYLRGSHRKLNMVNLDQIPDTVGEPDDPLEIEQDERALIEVLRELNSSDQLLVMLYYYENQSVREIAEITGLSESNVKMRMFRLRKKIRQELIVNFENRFEQEK
jgi:RNA polymerase sigma-70 factor (ECF subfamily)